MIFTPTGVPEVLVIEFEKREDARGYFARAWCESEFSARRLPGFVQTNMSSCRRKDIVRSLQRSAGSRS